MNLFIKVIFIALITMLILYAYENYKEKSIFKLEISELKKRSITERNKIKKKYGCTES